MSERLSEWQAEQGEQGRDKGKKEGERGKTVSCAWQALFRGAHVTRLLAEGHLVSGEYIS